jgi:hypothetical protein
MFKSYLQVHHTSEDDMLWPPMRQALPDDSAGWRCSTRWKRSTPQLIRCWPRSMRP